MAIHNDPRLYSGGSAVVNASPSPFLIQALAKKQAQQDALDQYYRQAQERLSESQIRSQDAQGLQDKLDNIGDYYLKNKKSILNGNAAAVAQYEDMWRDAHSYINDSKNAAQKDLKWGNDYLMRKIEPTKDDMNIMAANAEPINSPHHWKNAETKTPYEHTDLTAYQPDLDEKKYLQTLTFGQKPSETPVGQPQSLGNFRFRQQSEVGFSPKQIKTFGDKAMADAATNPSVKKLASQRYDYIDLNPNMKEDLNNTFKQIQGRDAQSPSDFYAAEVMKNLSGREQKYKEYEDKGGFEDYRQKHRIQLASISDAYAKGRQEFGHALSQADKQTANLWIDDYVSGLASKANNPVQYKTAKGDVTIENMIPLDPTMAKALAKDGIQPDQLRVTQDGQFRPVWFKRDDKGQIQQSGNVAAIDNIRSVPISQDQLKLALGKTAAGTKQTNIEMTKPSTKYSIKGKTYTEKQLMDMGYKLDQIAPYKVK